MDKLVENQSRLEAYIASISISCLVAASFVMFLVFSL